MGTVLPKRIYLPIASVPSVDNQKAVAQQIIEKVIGKRKDPNKKKWYQRSSPDCGPL